MENRVYITIPKKSKVDNVEKIKIKSDESVYKLNEVQAIKDAAQEHLIFIGLDNANNLRAINFLSIGTSKNLHVDTKDIVRTALITNSDKVIFVHNHPSNSLLPSNFDKHFTDKVCKMLKVFNIEVLDHIIVTEESYSSMQKQGNINRNYEDKDTHIIDNTILIEENMKLKNKIRRLERNIELER